MSIQIRSGFQFPQEKQILVLIHAQVTSAALLKTISDQLTQLITKSEFTNHVESSKEEEYQETYQKMLNSFEEQFNQYGQEFFASLYAQFGE